MTQDRAARPRVEGLPGPVTFASLVAMSARLYARRPVRLIAIFLAFYGLTTAASYGLIEIDISDAILRVIFRLLFAMSGAFAMSAAAVYLADAAVGRETERGAVPAVLKVHARQIFTAGLLSTLLLLVLELLPIGPLFALAVIGPPLIVHMIVLEYRTFQETIARLRELVVGQWGRVLVLALAVTLTLLLFQAAIALIGASFIRGASESVREAFWTVYLVIAPALAAPFFAASSLVVYLEVRHGNERLDPEGFAAERQEAMGEQPVTGSTQG